MPAAGKGLRLTGTEGPAYTGPSCRYPGPPLTSGSGMVPRKAKRFPQARSARYPDTQWVPTVSKTKQEQGLLYINFLLCAKHHTRQLSPFNPYNCPMRSML